MDYKFSLSRFSHSKLIFYKISLLAFSTILLSAGTSLGQTTVKSSVKKAPPKKPLSKTTTSPQANPKSVQSKPLSGQSFIVSGFNVNVRENSSSSAADIGQLTFGTLVRSTERSKTEEAIGGKKGFWHKVTVQNGKSGWVFGGFLKTFEPTKREIIYKQITAEKLKITARSFDENTEFYDFLTRVQPEVKTPEIAAEIGLWRLLTLKNALSTIPFDKIEQSPYKDFTAQNSINIVYDEPGGRWLVRSERFWSLAKRYANLPIGEKIAWEAAQNPLPGECEGYLNCYLYLVRVTNGEYLERFPKGAHAAEALKSVEDFLQPIADDAKKKEIYDTPLDVSDRAEFYQNIAELRTIISRTGFFEKESVLRQLDKIAEGYR